MHPPRELEEGDDAVQAVLTCPDLLKSMLTVEPTERITIQGILSHPWFLKDLPPGTHDMNARLQSYDKSRRVSVYRVPPLAQAVAQGLASSHSSCSWSEGLKPRNPGCKQGM